MFDYLLGDWFDEKGIRERGLKFEVYFSGVLG